MSRPLVMGQVTAQRKQRMIADDIVDFGSTWSSDKIIRIVERRNLLDNWYFILPVNQRGLLEYLAGQQAIDRWFPTRLTCTVVDNGIRLIYPTELTGHFLQRIEFPERYLGKQFTLSVMKDGSIYETTVVLPPVFVNGEYGRVRLPEWSHFLSIQGNTIQFAIAVNARVTMEIQAAKLELGRVSTLANDPPMDFGRELAVCQRYQIVVQRNTTIRMSHHTQNQMVFILPTNTQMRINPNIVNGPVPWRITLVGNVTQDLEFNFNHAIIANGMGLNITVTRNGHGMSDAVLAIYEGMLFDANL